MAIYDAWSTIPSENNAAPPSGAGEGKMPLNMITDTFRIIMAAIKELASSSTGPNNDQRFYNLIYPVGSKILWHSANQSGLVWPGVKATWNNISHLCPNGFVAIIGSNTFNGTVSGTRGFDNLCSTGYGGEHEHLVTIVSTTGQNLGFGAGTGKAHSSGHYHDFPLSQLRRVGFALMERMT